MQKRYLKLNENELSKTTDFFVEQYGLPKLIDRFNLYFFNPQGAELQMKFKNSNIYLKENKINDVFGWVEIKNRCIKSVFQTLNNLGFSKVLHGKSDTFEFDIAGGLIASIFKDSFKGSFVEFEYSSKLSEYVINDIVSDIGLEDKTVYDTESFSRVPLNDDVQAEVLFDNAGRLNKSIKDYCVEHGVEIRTDNLTLGSRLEGVSNDYGKIEEKFKQFSDRGLVDGNVSEVWESDFMTDVSIIVPSYNSHDKLEYTLKSINSQTLTDSEFEMVEVIVVDDCSNVNVMEVIEKLKPILKYTCKSIRLNQNMDVAFARNIGAASAQFDNFIFLDSDILISKDYIKNMLYRTRLIPNAVFTSFRKNILLTDDVLNDIDAGLENPVGIDDSRISNKTKLEQVGWNEHNQEVRQFDIFDDTDGFKNLGFGASVGVYDLPGILSGHNIVISRENFYKVNGFCTDFKGWGMEDKFFGLNVILEGNFIIPVISSMVYHLEYGPREGNLERKVTEVHANYEMYKKRLGDIW